MNLILFNEILNKYHNLYKKDMGCDCNFYNYEGPRNLYDPSKKTHKSLACVMNLTKKKILTLSNNKQSFKISQFVKLENNELILPKILDYKRRLL